MGPNDFYMTFKIDGRNVAAVYTLRPEPQARGVPAHWSLHVAVENADTAADRARGRHNGFGIKGVPGTFCVADLSTSDQDGASRFYE